MSICVQGLPGAASCSRPSQDSHPRDARHGAVLHLVKASKRKEALVDDDIKLPACPHERLWRIKMGCGHARAKQ